MFIFSAFMRTNKNKEHLKERILKMFKFSFVENITANYLYNYFFVRDKIVEHEKEIIDSLHLE